MAYNYERNYERYERPSVTADIIALRLRNEKPDDYRRAGRTHVSLLLIKRGIDPYEGLWALPGGFLRRGETIEACAVREMQEETGLFAESIAPIGVFSRSDRDPRGWILSNAFLTILPLDHDPAVSGGTDASAAVWFDVEGADEEDGAVLSFRSDEGRFTARLKRSTRYGHTTFETADPGLLAFDHAEIIASALDVLKKRAVQYETVFSFLPEKFTLSAAQRVQEAILQKTDAPANFRRKIADYVEECGEYETGSGHRPAMLYKKRTDRG